MQETDLTKRVEQWEDKIKPILAVEVRKDVGVTLLLGDEHIQQRILYNFHISTLLLLWW